jgi:hypothetical protein
VFADKFPTRSVRSSDSRVVYPVISCTAVSCFHGLSVRFELKRSFPFLGTNLFSVCCEAIDRFNAEVVGI